jgi:glycosyltransferase involved in cell wall biosynthesis
LDIGRRRHARLREEHKLTTAEPNPEIAAWKAGSAPVAVVMISLNESHNMDAVLQNLAGWAQEVFLVDSYSDDETVDIALRHGVHVVQRRFKGFGDQWNFALRALPISAPWTMKLDPDERLTDELKRSLFDVAMNSDVFGASLCRKLWFMGKPLPVRQTILRAWRTGSCRFTDVAINEYPVVAGKTVHIKGDLEHYDSPDLQHWYDKQNRYSTAEALIRYTKSGLADRPIFFGTPLQRRMWLKHHFNKLPLRHIAMFLYCFLVVGAWRVGKVGWIWSRLRAEVFRMQEYKLLEMQMNGRKPSEAVARRANPNKHVRQYE